MTDRKKLLLGIDFGKDYIQICFYNHKTMEPESITLSQGKYLYPALVGSKTGGKEWAYGEEVLSLEQEGLCQKADNLLEKAMAGDEILLYDKAYTAAFLLEKLFRKCLTLVTLKFPGESIGKITITVKKLNENLKAALTEAFYNMGIKEDRLVLQSNSLSCEYYALSQKKELWLNDVGLFHMDEEEFYYSQISINRRLSPIPVGISRRDLSDILSLEEVEKDDRERAEYCFLNLAKGILHKQLISTIYVTGAGFEGDWVDNALKELCTGRRVFKGQNLYAKGACYTSREKENEQSGALKEYIFLDSDRINALITAAGYKEGEAADIPLWDGYKAWYDIPCTQEFIITESNVINLQVKDLFTLKKEYHQIVLEGLEVKKDKSARVEISLTFQDDRTAEIKVRDTGFGQFRKSSGLRWEKLIKLFEDADNTEKESAGVLILCDKVKAEVPYRFKITGTVVHNTEELYYYIHHNFLLLTDELLEEEFLLWVERELKQVEKALKLREIKTMLSGYEALLEAAAVFLLDTDYYTKTEAEEFLNKQKERKNISPAEMALKKGDSFLAHGQYADAGLIYEILINNHSNTLTTEVTGRIRHNLGICRLHLEGLLRAKSEFMEAYRLNGSEESKRQYYLCVLLSGETMEEADLSDATEGNQKLVHETYIETLKEEIQQSLLRFKDSDNYMKLAALKEAKDTGRLNDFKREVNDIIALYKEEYRKENS
ncbi:DUF5716 family protein [Anaerocolumna sp. AGMB13020]|uniref:DUF5716 family protein n=1 Tax=Anaerocolumna sp. AGMB13020 TaxID=3081750 RepID=UPI002953AF27|nr:DUF5716 family protein [Anaerocolumna sp. AGMB13020]WOO38455.1 DUF5716 family protein [Anaerocolumna sp. AGMB13020]